MGSNVIKGEFMLVDGIKMVFLGIELYNKYEEFIINMRNL